MSTLPILGGPVLRKDLRLHLRARESTRALTFYISALGVVIVAFMLRQIDPTSEQLTHPGLQLLQVLAFVQLGLILCITPVGGAASISGERVKGTWDLLILTRSSPTGLACAKLAHVVIFNLLLLLATIPLYSLVLYLYHVGLPDLIHIYVVFLATVVLVSSISLLASAATSRPAVSTSVAIGAALILTLALSMSLHGSEGLARISLIAAFDPLAALVSATPGTPGAAFLHLSLDPHPPVALWKLYTLASLVLSLLLVVIATPLLSRPTRRHA